MPTREELVQAAAGALSAMDPPVSDTSEAERAAVMFEAMISLFPPPAAPAGSATLSAVLVPISTDTPDETHNTNAKAWAADGQVLLRRQLEMQEEGDTPA